MRINKKPTAQSIKADSISAAVEHIQCAITLLGDTCKEDSIAREALVNLGVVAADLNSSISRR